MAPPEIGTSFTVEISSTAWKQLSTLPLEMYQRVRTELDFNAAALISALPPAGPADADQVLPTRDFVVEGYVARYVIDPRARRLTLLSVEAAPK